MPVHAFVDAERLTDFCRAIGKLYAASTAAVMSHRIFSAQRLDCSNEYRRTLPFQTADNIHAVVHAIGKIHIQVATRAKHHISTRRTSAEAMAGCIVLVVGFGFNYLSNELFPTNFPYQFAPK